MSTTANVFCPTVDALSAAEFQDALRLVARLDRPVVVADPLAAAVAQIEQHPLFTQSRLLARILTALIGGEGVFRRAEISALDSPTRGLVLALMNDSRAGTASREAWARAVAAANAAQLAAES